MSRKPLAPGPQRVVDVLVEVERRQDEHARRSAARRAIAPGRLDAVHPRHPHVHEHDVGIGARGRGATASLPSAASPTTSMSGCASRISRKPPRTSAWSSATSTRITTRSARSTGGPDGVPAARFGSGVQVAAVHGGPFAHPGEAAAVVRPVSDLRSWLPKPVVAHLEVKLLRAVLHTDPDLLRIRVPERVGQGLLHDAVRRQTHARSYWPDRADQLPVASPPDRYDVEKADERRHAKESRPTRPVASVGDHSSGA